MELSDIRINPNNYKRYNVINVRSFSGKEAIDVSDDIGRYFDEKLGDKIDWAGRYATWLNKLGFKHETDNGWWNVIAVTPENIGSFVRYNEEDDEGERINQEFIVAVNKLHNNVKRMRTIYSIRVRRGIHTVDELIEEINNQEKNND